MLPNNTQVREEISGEIKNYFELSEDEKINMDGIEQKQEQREIYSIDCVYQEREEI